MPTHLGGDYEPTPFRSMEDHLAKANHLSMKNLRVKGSSFDASTDRKTSLLRDRPARRAVKRAYRIWVSDAAHHCVQLRIDLLFTMSDNLHRVIEDRRDTNSSSWTSGWCSWLAEPKLAAPARFRPSGSSAAAFVSLRE